MARQIKIENIGDHFEKKVKDAVRKGTFKWESLVVQATPVWDPLPNETGVGGTLKGSWQSTIRDYEGIVSTNIEYSEPVVFGVSLPPSWGGKYRTRQNTIKGYPELQAKQVISDIKKTFGR